MQDRDKKFKNELLIKVEFREAIKEIVKRQRTQHTIARLQL